MAQQRHKIIRKKLALRRDGSVSGVTVGTGRTPTGDPSHAHLHHCNDGITLCREPPPAVDEGEILVASNKEMHAAPFSGKRLLALWNALPDVDEVASATGWQRHTVHGVFSETFKKKLGFALASAKEERGPVYRIAAPASP